MNDILPDNMKDKTNQYIPRTMLPCECLEKCLKRVFSKGWVDMQCVYTLEQLLNLCGTDWFSDRAVLVSRRATFIFHKIENFLFRCTVSKSR